MTRYILLGVGLVGAVVLVVVLCHGSYTFTVANNSSKAIEECLVYIGEKRFEYNNIAPGAFVTETVSIHQDTHFIVLARLETGKEMYAELGYATAGAELTGEISITDSEITLSNDSIAEGQ